MADYTFQLILASASPRRSELLSAEGIPFRCLPQDVDESLDADQMAEPYEAVKKLAERKAGAAVQELLDENPTGIYMVLGSDTMVVLDGEIYGKPANFSQGRYMLGKLSGRTHQVMTGVSVWMVASDADDPEKVSIGFRSFTETSDVTFRELTDQEIVDYLKTGEAYDKAGGYGIQGRAKSFVSHIAGDIDTVIGLPVQRLLREFPELKTLNEEQSDERATSD